MSLGPDLRNRFVVENAYPKGSLFDPMLPQTARNEMIRVEFMVDGSHLAKGCRRCVVLLAIRLRHVQ